MSDLFTMTYPSTPGWKEPTTSRDAAKRLEQKACIARDQARILYALRRQATCKELAELLKLDINYVRPRCTELKDDGLLEWVVDKDGDYVKHKGEHYWIAI